MFQLKKEIYMVVSVSNYTRKSEGEEQLPEKAVHARLTQMCWLQIYGSCTAGEEMVPLF